MQNDYHISTTLKLDRSITNPYPFFPLLWGEMFIIIKTMICFLFFLTIKRFMTKLWNGLDLARYRVIRVNTVWTPLPGARESDPVLPNCPGEQLLRLNSKTNCCFKGFNPFCLQLSEKVPVQRKNGGAEEPVVLSNCSSFAFDRCWFEGPFRASVLLR